MIIHSYLYKNNNLHQKNLNIDAIYDKTIQRIKFMEDDFNIEVSFSPKSVEYIRKNNEYIFTFKIGKKTSCEIHLLEYKQKMPIKVIEHSINNKENQIEFTYRLETEEDTLNKVIIVMEND